MSKSRVYWSAGCFFACVVGWVCLTNGKHWRVLLFILSLPCFVSIWDLRKNGVESLRYLWIRKDVEGVTKILDMMAEKNGKEKLSRENIIESMNK